MILQKALRKLGFKKLPGPGDAFQLDGLYAEVHTNNKIWQYGWITGNANMDNKSFPGGRVFENEAFLKQYVNDYLK